MFVLDITKKTKDVFDDLGPLDYIFSSRFNTFKILAKGTYLNLSVTGNPTTFTLAHGLPFTPNFYAYCRFPDGKVALAGPLSFSFRGLGTTPLNSNYGEFTPEVDASNLYFVLTKPGSNYSVDVAYRIFEVPLA